MPTFTNSLHCLLVLLYRVWSSCERKNASQHPSSFHRGPQHEGCQVCRLPGHCAFWTASCHLSRSVSCAVAGQTECENISEDTLLASFNKNTGNSYYSIAITWWNQSCLPSVVSLRKYISWMCSQISILEQYPSFFYFLYMYSCTNEMLIDRIWIFLM